MDNMKIINLTPHEVTIYDKEGFVKETFESEGIARVKQTSVKIGELNGIELVKTSYGEPEGLPAFAEGTYYIVSQITANAAREQGRTTADLLLTSDSVRDAEGNIVGCRQLAQL